MDRGVASKDDHEMEKNRACKQTPCGDAQPRPFVHPDEEERVTKIETPGYEEVVGTNHAI
jgi:hypothetical protein